MSMLNYLSCVLKMSSRANVLCVLTWSRGNVPCLLTRLPVNVSCVLTCQHVFRPYVFTYQHALYAYVFTCQRASFEATIFSFEIGNNNWICEICWKLTIKPTDYSHWRRSGVKHNSHFGLVFLVSLLLTLNS